MHLLKRHLTLSSKTAFLVLSLFTFLFSAQISLTIYIDSSYLKHAIESTPSLSAMRLWEDPEHAVGTLYTLASLVTLIALLYTPRLLRRFGNYRWTLSVMMLHIMILLGLGIFDSGLLIIPLFILETAIISILYYNLDIFLERYSKDETTGMIRGLFLMIGSIAWILPPFFAGHIIDNKGFSLVYLSGAALMIPALFLLMRYFRNFQDLTYDDTPLIPTHKESLRHPNISHILASNFMMHCFYALMIIYFPLYLHNHLGFTFTDIGTILTIALTAFIIFPYPTGWIADKLLGEKELLVTGFLLMGITTALIPTLGARDAALPLWTLLLFIGRAGASTVETMNETYFFKQIDGHDAGIMGYFRRSRALAFLFAPLLASLLMKYGILTIEHLFYLLAIIMICAVYFPLKLKDTK